MSGVKYPAGPTGSVGPSGPTVPTGPTGVRMAGYEARKSPPLLPSSKDDTIDRLMDEIDGLHYTIRALILALGISITIIVYLTI